MGRKNRGELIRVENQNSVRIIIQNIIIQTHAPNYLLCVPNAYNANFAILVTWNIISVLCNGQKLCFQEITHLFLVAIKIEDETAFVNHSTSVIR